VLNGTQVGAGGLKSNPGLALNETKSGAEVQKKKKARCLQDPTPTQMVHRGVSASCEEQRFESAHSTR